MIQPANRPYYLESTYRLIVSKKPGISAETFEATPLAINIPTKPAPKAWFLHNQATVDTSYFFPYLNSAIPSPFQALLMMMQQTMHSHYQPPDYLTLHTPPKCYASFY